MAAGRSRRDPRRARGAARASSARALEANWRAAYAATARQPLRISRRRPRARAGCARSRSGYIVAAGARGRAGAGLAPVRRGRQHDRPAGRARRAGQRRRAASAKRRSPPSTTAIATMRWCSTNGSRRRRCRPATIRSRRSRRWRSIPISRSPTPIALRALVGAFAANQRAFHDASGRGYRFLADMILARRQAQSADRGAAGAAARPLAPLRRGARRADARGARADRGDAGASQGCVRAGVEEPGVKGTRTLAPSSCSGEGRSVGR